MSWCDRRGLLGLAMTAAALATSGCFRPMLAEGAPAAALRDAIALPPVEGRLSRVLVETLQSRLGRGGADARFSLSVDQDFDERGLLIRQDNAVTRIQVRARARYRLTAAGAAEPVLEGSIISEAGYDQTASLFATRTTRRAVQERLSRDLAERLARRILANADRLGATG